MRNDETIKELIIHLSHLGYSKSTQYQVPACIKEFLIQTNKTIVNIKQADILSFLEYLQYRPLMRSEGLLSESMIHHYIYALKLFFSWLEQTSQITSNPISNIKFKKPTYTPRQPLTQQEIKQLFKAAANTKEIATLHLFYSCGLRRTEAVDLNTNDIHFGTQLLYVREGKNSKRRVVPINKSVKKAFEMYLRNRYNPHKEEAFMLNSIGVRMRGDIFNKTLKNIISKSEINHLKDKVSLHHLRHSIATHLLENGMSIEFVREFLGHSNLEATQIYTKVNKKMLNFK